MEKIILKIKGMHCESCARLIQETLLEKGVNAKVEFSTSRGEFQFDRDKISINEIITTIKELGYKAKI